MKCLRPLLRSLRLPLVLLAVSLAGCTDEHLVAPDTSLLDGAPAASERATDAERHGASGSFTVALTGPPTVEPVGANCRLSAPVALTLTGALEGTASGEIDVLVFASCTDVGTHPPGTFPDRFRATTTFEGTLLGTDGTASLTYLGRTAAGGAVRGLFLVQGPAVGVLKVEATAGVGGSYRGLLVPLP